MLELHEITYGSVLLRLLLATIIGGILGWERGRKNRPAGLRTYMLDVYKRQHKLGVDQALGIHLVQPSEPFTCIVAQILVLHLAVLVWIPATGLDHMQAPCIAPVRRIPNCAAGGVRYFIVGITVAVRILRLKCTHHFFPLFNLSLIHI